MKKRKKTVKNKEKKGFTLIELLVVSTIMVVISAIGLVSFSSATKGARDAQRKKDLDNVRQALLLYRVDMGSYPATSYNYKNAEEVSVVASIFNEVKSLFTTKEVFAVANDPIFIDPIDDDSLQPTFDPVYVGTPIPTINPEVTKIPLTPTPTSTPTFTTVASPTPDSTIDVINNVSGTSYITVANSLKENGYLDGELPVDPKNNDEYYYGYEISGSIFTLTAQMEKEQDDGTYIYTITN